MHECSSFIAALSGLSKTGKGENKYFKANTIHKLVGLVPQRTLKTHPSTNVLLEILIACSQSMPYAVGGIFTCLDRKTLVIKIIVNEKLSPLNNYLSISD